MKKIKFSKRIIIMMLIFLLLFTIACLVVNATTGNEPSTLITAVFAFCSVEGGIMGFIRIFKKETKKEIEEETEEEKEDTTK